MATKGWVESCPLRNFTGGFIETFSACLRVLYMHHLRWKCILHFARSKIILVTVFGIHILNLLLVDKISLFNTDSTHPKLSSFSQSSVIKITKWIKDKTGGGERNEGFLWIKERRSVVMKQLHSEPFFWESLSCHFAVAPLNVSPWLTSVGFIWCPIMKAKVLPLLPVSERSEAFTKDRVNRIKKNSTWN